MSEDKSDNTWRAMLSGKPEPHPWRPAAIGVGGFLYTVITIWLLGHFIHALIAGNEADDKFEGIRNLGLILVATIGAPFVLYRTWVLGRQAKTAERQSELAEDRNFSDLFTKAVEQLGADKIVKRHATDRDGNLAYDEHGVPVMQETTEPNLEVRLGAIYALQRISRASEKDHIPIMETLCAYIRENAIGGEPDKPSKADDLSTFWLPSRPLRSDVRAALSTIAQRSAKLRLLEETNEFQLDFRRANLQRAEFYELQLRSVDLSYAHLEGSNLIGAKLERANFFNAKLNRASLGGAKLQNSNMMLAELHRADLEYANLSGASLAGAELDRSNLANAVFQHAHVDQCSFRRANICCADFRNVEGLIFEQIESCFGCVGTKLPVGLTRPNHWHKEALANFHEQETALRDWLATR